MDDNIHIGGVTVVERPHPVQGSDYTKVHVQGDRSVLLLRFKVNKMTLIRFAFTKQYICLDNEYWQFVDE